MTTSLAFVCLACRLAGGPGEMVPPLFWQVGKARVAGPGAPRPIVHQQAWRGACCIRADCGPFVVLDEVGADDVAIHFCG